MSSELSLLIPDFRKKVSAVIAACKARNVRMEVLTTLITPLEQAALWKQGRTATDAELKALALDNAGAHYLASLIRLAQPKETNLVTESLPGCSWHQWGESACCVWIDKRNRLNFSPQAREGVNPYNGYDILAEEAIKAGIIHGNVFDDNVKESWTLLQYRPERSPNNVYTLIQIDAEMKKRFAK